jgi:hypothetical protein
MQKNLLILLVIRGFLGLLLCDFAFCEEPSPRIFPKPLDIDLISKTAPVTGTTTARKESNNSCGVTDPARLIFTKAASQAGGKI